jgi:hypothetical protein
MDRACSVSLSVFSSSDPISEERRKYLRCLTGCRLFAQLSSAAHAPHNIQGPEILDGPIPPFDFGPRGMYASFDWEDLDALAPWLELREIENGNDGMGVDVPADGPAAGAGQAANRSAGVHRAGLGFGR